MNIVKIADALAEAKNMDSRDPKKVEISQKIAGAVQAYFNPAGTAEKFRASVQAGAHADSFGVSSDLARVNRQTFDFIMDKTSYDNGWELAFKTVPLKENDNSWEIHTGASGLKLQLRAEGEKLDLKSFSSERETIYINKYGMGIGVTDEMIRFRQTAKMLDMMEEARDAYLIGKSQIFYNLMVASGAGNVTAYQGAVADGQLQRDIQTINAGANSIGNRMRDKIANAATAPLLMYANPNDESRLEAAFRATTASMATAARAAAETTRRPISRIYTYNVLSGAPLLVVPGRKNQFAQALGLTQFTQQDILIFAYIQAYWTYFGGTAADSDQYQTLTLG